ncbi:MAG: AMP-binding protein, partial [Acidimicrobiia bacterium]|nr:AMP-binding protein [Acidimicrobiia bacterium]
VFVQLPRTVEWYATLLGCFQIGAVPMPATTQLMPKDQQYRINRAEAAAAVCDGPGARRLNEVQDDCPSLRARYIVGSGLDGWEAFGSSLEGMPATAATVEPTGADDPLLLYFTSGTTGGPKMVQHVGSYALAHEITARFWHDLSADDVHWTVSDTGWAKAAWGKLFGQWIIGAAVVMWDIVGKPDFDRMLRLIGELGVTSFCAPPTLYRAFAQMDLSRYDWSTLRHCTSAGEPLNPEVIESWKAATGTVPYDGYGQTESVCLVANYPSLPVKPGSMGRPAPGMDVDVVDDDGKICADGVEGNIAVRTDPWPVGLFRGYWQDDERTAQVFQHGWYYTGDRAYRDEDGYLWFVGRADDVILSAAYRIGPFEVESALIEHPAVAEAAVVGKPDAERGNIVKAFIILAPGYEASQGLTQEIQDHVKSITAPYKYPRDIEYVTELPKTVSGKIRRVELRERA